MGNKKSNTLQIFNDFEEQRIIKIYNEFGQNKFDINRLIDDVFLGLKITKENIYSYLNKFTQRNTITSFEDFKKFVYLLTYINQNEKETMNFYYTKSTFEIVYDMCLGYVGAYESKKDESVIINILIFIIKIYYSRIYIKVNEEEIVEYIKRNKFSIDELYNLEDYLKSYFKFKLLNSSYIKLPILTELSSIITPDKFVIWSLMNPHIYNKPKAFKLYECKKQGFSISSMIYSFIGFTGPIIILIEHYKDNKEYVLGSFIYSNIKECYEKYCGDEFSYLFTINPIFNMYKFKNYPNKICYINPRKNTYSHKDPGIGFGDFNDRYRLWIDEQNISNSYFKKFDLVFETGTILNSEDEKLNIINIEVYGFGDDDDLKALIRKQERDGVIKDQMRKVDKSHFVNNEFDREMFLSKTFSHQNN